MEFGGRRLSNLFTEKGGTHLKSKRCPICRTLFFLFSSLVFSMSILAQQFDLLIQGGHVIDPKNQIDSVMDIAITAGKIARVSPDIPSSQAKQVVSATGSYLTPGLIDIHAPLFYGTLLDSDYGGGYFSIPPDGFPFRSG